MRFPKEAYEHEKAADVFIALVETLPEGERAPWVDRWHMARAAEMTMREYNRAYDESLRGTTRFGQ